MWDHLARRTTPPPASGNESIPLASAVSQNLDNPWEMAFLPDGRIIVTERPGRVRLIDVSGTVSAQPILTLDDVAFVGDGGLLGLTLHPNFAVNGFVYFFYTYRSGTGLANRVVRYTLQGSSLTNRIVIIEGIPGSNIRDGGRIKFGPDGYLYICTGDAGTDYLAQDLNSLAGKILRLKDDGSIPSNNPFPGSAVYSYGHRDPEGLVWDDQGRMWEIEQGPNSQDEINLIEAGKNYGWPIIHGDETSPGLVSPVFQSASEDLAPSGLTCLKGDLYFAGLNGQSLYQFNISAGTIVPFLAGDFGRLRDVILGPDGLLYILTNNRDGRGIPLSGDDMLIRVNPDKLAASGST